MKSFEIPEFYRSPIISKVKLARKSADPRKQDFSPTRLNFGQVEIYLARHFGFCFGVENAIEISYKALAENPGKRIFLLSQMIHNPDVNADLVSNGINFIQDTYGNMLMDWDQIKAEDVVIVPAFGTTLEIEKILAEKGVDTKKYNTTCPFVERVWKRSAKLGKENFTIIIHGKETHEETRATFSHSAHEGPSIVIRDMAEAVRLGDFISGKLTEDEFWQTFRGRTSANFTPAKDLQKVGVVNQTTMLASETQAIANYMKTQMAERYVSDSEKDHFADTRDTLCYATNENQQATSALLDEDADLAIVVGGFNSSNTTHLVELCQEKLPTYFIKNESGLVDGETITHFDIVEKLEKTSKGFLAGDGRALKVLLTSGASCPDAVVDRVLHKLLAFVGSEVTVEEALQG